MKDREPTDARQQNLSGQQEQKKTFSPSSAARQPEANQSETYPVIEEKLQVGKKQVETGSIKLHKRVTEEDVNIDLSLEHDEIDVERVAVNQYVEEAPPAIRHEGDTMIIPVLREEIVKRLVVVEELHITRRKKQEEVHDTIKLKKEEIEVERNSNNNSSSPTPPSQPK
ncbi:YsnF/AvaK domain-containing protein [Nafulsella turpanensis]|uniref:YsnF/AvaK domain-containing protein n=1 Tax=Nafulsella turpanensis TaxID=1265690 RepID=UPI00034C8E3E|nr:YsnF/AvaK domain-containing protein [Nafulsella turpanensis]